MEATAASESPVRAPAAGRPVRFPSLEFFEKLAEEMKADRVQFSHLGDIDCKARFVVTDAPKEALSAIDVTFEEFDVTRIEEATETYDPDFSVEASLETWKGMLESIAAGGGKPSFDQTLNFLSLPSVPVAVKSDDPVRRDLFFRFNQTLQEFFNHSAKFPLEFPEG